MSQENAEIVRELYHQFARGDFSWFAQVPDDFEFVASPELPDAGTYRGAEASRWMTAWVESFEGHTMEATEIIDAGGDAVVVAILQRGRPRGSQAVVEGRWWVATRIREGVASRAEVFPDRVRPSKPRGCRSRPLPSSRGSDPRRVELPDSGPVGSGLRGGASLGRPSDAGRGPLGRGAPTGGRASPRPNLGSQSGNKTSSVVGPRIAPTAASVGPAEGRGPARRA
jgi:ketosteroid isomerase-like protein